MGEPASRTPDTARAVRGHPLPAGRATSPCHGFVRHRFTRRHRGVGVIAALSAVLAVLAGCTAGADDSAAGSVTAGPDGFAQTHGPDDGADMDADMGADVDASGREAGQSLRTVGLGAGRRVVRTAQLELEVEDSAGAADAVAAIAVRRGGFVAETDLARDAGGLVRGSITLRVPSEELIDVVEELDALAVAVPVRRIDEQDVTAQSTDLTARLTNLRTYEDELRALLADVRQTTTRPDDLLTVFERIRGVRAEIDQAEATLAVLDDAVALSTVHVGLRPATSAAPVLDPAWAPSETIRDALSVTTRALSSIADAVIRIALTGVPVALMLGLPLVAGTLMWRRSRVHRRT